MFESVAANLYRAVMWAGHLVCSQNPARSPHLFGAQLPLCWRCTGIVVGSFALIAWLFTKRRLPALWLSLALSLVMPLDVLYALLTHGEGDNGRRLASGTLFGFFAAALALHFFTRLAARDRRSRADTREREDVAQRSDDVRAARGGLGAARDASPREVVARAR